MTQNTKGRSGPPHSTLSDLLKDAADTLEFEHFYAERLAGKVEGLASRLGDLKDTIEQMLEEDDRIIDPTSRTELIRALGRSDG